MQEIQRNTKDGKSYTDFTSRDFDCGRYKKLTEINQSEEEESVEEEPAEDPLNDTQAGGEEDLEVFSLMDEDDEDINCGSTIINDRWLISSARCFDKFLNPGEGVSLARQRRRDIS